MPYVPVSVDVYVAAYAGIMGAIANVRQTTDAVAADYDHDTKVAGAFAQAFDAAYNNATPNELQIEEIQSLSNEIFSNVFPTGAGSELVTGPGYTALANAIIARLTQADAFFAGQGIVPPVITPVETLGPFNTVATGAVGSGRLLDVTAAQIAALKSSGSVAWVNSVKDFWRWDSLSTLVADNIKVCNPTVNGVAAGRFVRELIPAPEWMRQITWFVDPVAGNDEGDATTAGTAIKTDAERQRRMGQWPTWLLAEYHIRYLNDVPATDPVNIVGSFGLNTGNIYLHSSATDGQGKAVLATLAVDAITVVAHATNTPLLITSNGIAVSWTADGLLNNRCRFTTGGNIGGYTWPMADLGAKQARMSECQVSQTLVNPLPFGTGTFNPAAGNAFVVESLTALGVLAINMASIANTANTVVLDSLKVSIYSAAGNSAVYMYGCDWASTVSLPSFGRTGTFLGCKFRGNTKMNYITTLTIANCYADDSASGVVIITAGVLGNSALIRFMTQQRNGCQFFGASNSGTGSTHKTWDSQSGLGIFNNSGGPGVETYGLSLNSANDVWGVCGAGGTPFLLRAGGSLAYRALPTGMANYFFINVAAAPGAAWISYVSAQAVVTTAPTFDQATNTYTANRALTPANLQATIAAGGFAGQWQDPVSGCSLVAI